MNQKHVHLKIWLLVFQVRSLYDAILPTKHKRVLSDYPTLNVSPFNNLTEQSMAVKLYTYITLTNSSSEIVDITA